MTRARITTLAFAVLALAGCGGSSTPHSATAASHPAATVTVTARPAQPAVIADTSTPPGSRFCGRLAAAPDEAAYYASEVAYEARQGGGDINAGRTIVDLWITISCPQFAYLAKQD
jgi:hypothetical protein